MPAQPAQLFPGRTLSIGTDWVGETEKASCYRPAGDTLSHCVNLSLSVVPCLRLNSHEGPDFRDSYEYFLGATMRQAQGSHGGYSPVVGNSGWNMETGTRSTVQPLPAYSEVGSVSRRPCIPSWGAGASPLQAWPEHHTGHSSFIIFFVFVLGFFVCLFVLSF